MSGTSIDHTVAIIVFLAAMLIFIGLFSQTIQTGISYQQHNTVATKTGDLLDNLLLNPGNPSNWSQTDWNQQTKIPTSLGLQDFKFTQYQLNPLSLMRLYPAQGTSILYQGQTFVNTSTSIGQSSLLVPSSQIINYSQASMMMGINGTYGFRLSVYPTLDVSICEVSFSPLNVSVTVKGQGFSLANAAISYCLITVNGSDLPGQPSLNINYGTASTDVVGSVYLDLSSFNTDQKSYVLVVDASLSGLSGIGYFVHSSYTAGSVVPFISSFENRTVLLAHSYDVKNQGYNGNISYSASFFRATDLIQTTLNNGNVAASGILYLNPTPAHAFDTISIDPNTVGVLVIAYGKSAVDSGIVVMPWGLSSLGFSVTLGGQHTSQNWVSTDLRQVLVNGIPYQAKLELWSNPSNGVTG